jgi:hypothetical protein
MCVCVSVCVRLCVCMRMLKYARVWCAHAYVQVCMYLYHVCAGISDYYYNSVNAVFWPDADSDREPLV